MSREDVFKMMTQEQHDDYTRELEDKIEAREKEYISIKVKKDDYNSLMKNVLRTFRDLSFNVIIKEEK
tara:strand:+ start:5698 stop:5901 length:204 start_codon:yes stop_codon:yes gene_type:complete